MLCRVVVFQYILCTVSPLSVLKKTMHYYSIRHSIVKIYNNRDNILYVHDGTCIYDDDNCFVTIIRIIYL